MKTAERIGMMLACSSSPLLCPLERQHRLEFNLVVILEQWTYMYLSITYILDAVYEIVLGFIRS